MELNIHDKTLKYVGVINNNLPEALHYFDDKWHRYLAEGSSTFEFSVSKNNPDFSLIQESSYISFYYENEDYLFNIIGTKEDDKNSLAVSCVNLNLGLLYETLNAYSNTKRHSIVWYLKNAAKISDNILEIGQNPFSEVDEDKSNPILTFDSSETKLARIISICNSFSAEFKFSTKLKDDGTLQSITLDLFKAGGVGQVRKDVTLYYGKNITGITRTMDKKSIFNATTVTDSKNKYNWKAVEGKHYNSEGQLEFYKNAGENTAYALISRDTFPSQLKSDTNDQWIRKDFSIEASSEDSLWDYAVSQFKQFAYPQMTYEVSATSTAVTNALGDGRLLDIGDTVTIQDGNFDKADGGLILSARVSEQEISFTNPSSNSVTFTNFVKLKNQISADLWSRMKDIVDQSTPYRSELTTSNGVQFKNSAGSTTLSAHIYFGTNPEETTADQYEWFKDGVSVGKGQDLTVNADDIDGKAVYAYEATLDEKVVGRQEVTITDVSDGLDGRAIVSVEQKYQTSKEQKAPTDNWENENWKTDMPFTDPENKYLWQINHITYSLAPLTSDSISLIGTYGDQGETGPVGPPGDDGKPGEDGHDVWNETMTNGNMILPANALGGVLSYSNTGNSISVMMSNGDLLVPTDDLAKLSNNQFYVEAVGTNITPGTRTVDIENKVITFSNISNFPAEIGATGSISFEITVNVYGVVTKFSKLQNFTTSPQGITGNDGADTFTYIRYSNKSDGTDMVSLPNADSRFIGVYSGVAAIAPTDPKDYTWSRFNGATVLAQATEPEEAERFTGMLWQYTGTEDLSATGVTVESNTIYQWSGKVWQLFIMKSTNLQVDNGFITNAMIGDAQIKLANIDTASIEKLSVLSADLGEATAGSITLPKGDTGGVSVKDGIVKSWDISKVTDPNYPDGNSYTSMGAALDSGGITFYSADYGHKVDKGGVIDDQYKVATLRAIASNGRQNVGRGIVLEATDSDFPLNIIGNISVNNQLLYDIIYPIGCLYTSYVNQNPHDLYSIGTWTRINGRVIVGVSESESEFSSAGKTGGEKTHVLSANEMPSHGHTDSVDIKNANAEAKGYGLTSTSGFKDRVIINNSGKATHTGAAGGGAAHNNLQPYMALYMWRRTA